VTVLARLKEIDDAAYASTWGWFLPDWPRFTRPLLADRWFQGTCVVAGLGLVGGAVQGEWVGAIAAAVLTPFWAGNLRRLVAGTNARDRAHRVREQRKATQQLRDGE
jgi:hypothetical protein